MKKTLSVILFLFLALAANSQEVKRFKVNKIKILFLLDVSGSMNEPMGGKKRIDVAKTVLMDIADSLEKKYPNVYFALRVFGSEYHKDQKNCKDTRLAMPFAQKSRNNLKTALSKLTPRGMTPIAYSLQQAAKDFGNDSNCINSIVLLTDGDENCSGDPCAASDYLVKKRISFRPFIIGLGVLEKAAAKFECVGKFYNTNDEKSLRETVNILVRQTMKTTSAQINLIDGEGNPSITNIPFTLYDSETGSQEYNFVHTLNQNKVPDSLFLNPLGIYKVVVHSIPPVVKDNIELAVGQHNIIPIDVPLGTFTASCPGATFVNNDAQVVVRNTSGKIIYSEDLNAPTQYLTGTYKLDILTKPYTSDRVRVKAGAVSEKKIHNYGTVTISSPVAGKVTVSFLALREDVWVKVGEMSVSKKYESIRLQPDLYKLVYLKEGSNEMKQSKSKNLLVDPNRTTYLILD